jgi:hypothetical protein
MAKRVGDAAANLVIGADLSKLDSELARGGQKIEKFADEATKDANQVTAALNKVGEKGTGNLDKRLDATKAKVAALGKQIEKVNAQTSLQDSRTLTELSRTDTVKARGAGNLAIVGKQMESNLQTALTRQSNIMTEATQKRNTILARSEQNRLDFLYRLDQKQERMERNAAARTVKRYEAEQRLEQDKFNQLNKNAKAAGLTPSAYLFGTTNRSIGFQNTVQQVSATAAATGQRPSQVLQGMINQAAARANAAGAASMIPPAFGPPPRGGGGAGGGRSPLSRGIGRFGSALASGIGIGVGGFGGYAVASAARAVVDAAQTATAYDRQRVAAENLSGSQERLNELLNAYTEASGGAVNKATTLSNVTRLLATGFAESAPEVEKFVRATRGASIALGKPQDFVIQETQLAISNTSQKRLDQIGLSIEEVSNKIKELRRENAGWSREMAFQEAVLTIMDEKYGGLTDTLVGGATGLERMKTAWDDFILSLGSNAQGPINRLSGAIADLIKHLNDLETARAKAAASGAFEIPEGATQAERAGIRKAQGQDIMQRNDWANEDFWNQQFGISPLEQAQINAQRVLDNPGAMRWPTGAPRGDMPGVGGTGSSVEINEAREAAKTAAYDQMQAFEKQANQARLAEIQQYETQRASIISNYGKQVVREEQDFARQRARGLRDYERSIMEVMRDAQEREVEMQEDLDETLAEANEDSEKRVADLNEKYQKDKEKSEKDHIDRLMKAAGQLDAIAILEERKRWRRENEEREEGHKEALDEEKESLEERRQDAIEAHAERLEDARKADADRLEDMRVARAQQLADEDEDRDIRNTRAKEDFDDQIEELDRQHGITMARLAAEADEQRQALEDALEADLAAVGVYIEGYLEKVKKKDEAVEKWIDDFVEKLEKKIREDELIAEQNTYNPDSAVGPRLQQYASGGPVRRTGPAILHAGEFVLSKDMLAAANTSYNSSSSRSINFQPGAIVVQTSPGYEQQAADALEERLIELLGRV